MSGLDVPISSIQTSESDTEDEPIETSALLYDSATSTFVDDHLGVQATGAVKNILDQTREGKAIAATECIPETDIISDIELKRPAETELKDFGCLTTIPEWRQKDTHVFVLSDAGKPIYSRYGEESRLSSIIGVMQALVSFVATSGDELQSISAGERHFVFLRKPHLIFVAVGRFRDSNEHLNMLLNYVYNQILSLLTLQRIELRFERQQNLDLRRFLAGDTRLISSIIDFVEDSFGAFLQAVNCVPMATGVRDSISQLIIQSVKNRDVVFAVLLHRNQIVSLVRMKGQMLHPMDLHLIVNLVSSTQALKDAQTHWIPICLPKFDANGFLYANIAYLDNQTSLALLSVDNTQFYALQEAKDAIFECLRCTNDGEYLSVIATAQPPTVRETGVPELRHLAYRYSPVGQFFATQWSAPYVEMTQQSTSVSVGSRDAQALRANILATYRRMHARLHNQYQPARLVYQSTSDEAFFAWVRPNRQ
ncbi:Circulating cathodic antigen [Fasciola hepatica]|uniref:Vacuolar fusion protein MON1 homolog n=1 Tax=Fasciola hepatica TaxID=6192 RepID=A0A4E0R1G8_FASHE|nr:Circulating cathodic antigen [Fasciola hepatica]